MLCSEIQIGLIMSLLHLFDYFPVSLMHITSMWNGQL